MISFPNAKINLGLNVLRKREDGYHDIESCFFPIDLRDSLEIIKSEKFSFRSYGIEIPGDSETNLCVKAYDLLKDKYELPPIEIHLLKNIPIGAGLGGGSADGAFMLKLLNEQFSLGIATTDLQSYALQLGSDCPFFIENKPVIVSGRGEEMEPIDLDLSNYKIVVENPGIHISTKEAYSGVAPHLPKTAIREIVDKPIEEWEDQLINDFEPSVFISHPEIQEIKNKMYESGAVYSSMTGSGSAVFGIFPSSS